MIEGGLDLTPKKIISSIEAILQIFESFGINVNKSSRLYRFYCDYNNLIKSRDIPENIDELLEGMRDFFEIRQIVQAEELIKSSKKEIEEILGGNRVPSDDKNPLARNLQYQLFLASMFSSSDMKVRSQEPDFIFEYMGEEYSVAVKRITSKLKVKERLREAEKQIQRHCLNGFIALSLDRLLEQTNPFILLRDNAVLNEATKELIFSLARQNLDKECFVNRDPKVKGIIVTLGIPSFNPDDLSLGYGFNLQLFPLVDPTENEVEFDRIGKITEKLIIMPD